MPPILIDQQGDQLIFQNEDGSQFPVAASGLSPDYMNQLSSGGQMPQPGLVDQLSANTGGMSSIQNPGALDSAAQTSWQNNLVNRGPENISADELAAFNASKTQGAPLAFPNQELGSNIIPAKPMAAPEQIASSLPTAPNAPGVSQKEGPSQLEKGFAQIGRGIQGEADAQAEAAKATAAKYEEAANKMLQTEQKMAAIQEEGQKQYEAGMQRIAKAQDELKNIPIKNPWAEMSTGSKIGAALAIGLGAYSSSINGGPNQAYQIINDAMNRDVDLQMKRIDKKGKELAGEKDYLGLIRQATSDKQTQALMLKDLYLGHVENQIKQIAETSKSKEVQERAKQMLGALGQKRTEAGLDIAQKQANVAKTYAEIGAAAGGKPENFIPGVGMALTAEDAKEAKKINETALNFNKTLDDAIKHRETYGAEVLNRNAVAKGQSLGADLLLQVKNLGQLGVLSKSDIEDVINPLVPSDITEASPSTMERLLRAKEYVSNKVDAFYKSKGLQAPNKMLGTGERKVLANGAEFLIQGDKATPMNDKANQMIQAQKIAK